MPLPPSPPVFTRRLPPAPIGHADMLALQLGEPPLGGNRVMLLTGDAGTRLAVSEAIEGALDHLNLDAALLPADAPLLLERLAARCRAGVHVNLLHDPLDLQLRPGSPVRGLLLDAGVHLCERQPVRRRLLVADGRRALVGDASPAAGDLLLQIEGPAVQRLQRLFLAHWQTHAGATLQPARFFPPLAVAGTQRVAVATDDASGRRDGASSALLGAVATARSRITLATGGRVPARRLVAALAGAAARGVAVDLLLPGADDAPRQRLGVRSHYAGLLQAGVRVWERGSATAGTETCVIDGLWASIGAGPVAPGAGARRAGRADVVVLDTDFAARLEPPVRLQLALAQPVDAERWARRGWWERWREAVGARLDPSP